MTTTALDTLKIAEYFRSAGFSEHQSKALAEKFGDLANDHLVTREYLDFKLKELQLRLIISLGGLIVAVLTFFKAMEKFF